MGYWRIVEGPGFFRGSIEAIVLKFQKRPITPVLHHSITPIINNVIGTTDNPINKETQFKAVHSIRRHKDGRLIPIMALGEVGGDVR